jgi:hypothetical protein
MDRNAYRDDDGGEGADQPDAYWRRRVITLALGLGLLGILAWGFSGGGGKPVQSNPTAVLPAAALGTAIPGLLGSRSSPSVSGSADTPSVSPGPSARVSPSASPAASGSRRSSADGAQARPSSSSLAAAAGADGDRCAPGTVVLSLFTDRASYGPDQFPRFQVYAVSTSSGSCAFDPGQLQVVVLSSGRIVWDSADCDHGGGRIVELTRGIPAQASVTWNRAITLPGCQVLASSAHAGSYTVQAKSATVESPARIFKITGLSALPFSLRRQGSLRARRLGRSLCPSGARATLARGRLGRHGGNRHPSGAATAAAARSRWRSAGLDATAAARFRSRVGGLAPRRESPPLRGGNRRGRSLPLARGRLGRHGGRSLPLACSLWALTTALAGARALPLDGNP